MEHAEEIWNLLHDGTVTEVRGVVPGDLTFRVEIDYLTSTMTPPCDALEVTLFECDRFEYLSWQDDSRSADLRAFAGLEPVILSGSVTPEGVEVICGNGQFVVRYSGVAVARSDNLPTTIGVVDAVAEAYWKAFGNHQT